MDNPPMPNGIHETIAMSSKDRFDACLKLAEFGAGRWDARRQFDWRLTFALWALLVASISLVRVEELTFLGGVFLVVLYGF